MGMQTVAEGIETTGQADLLRALGCDMGQGYYFSEPLPAHEAVALLPVSSRPHG
jgi:EAL domain-containing protein (putative c-di-GMP-specific phosphodiesterase class I)